MDLIASERRWEGEGGTSSEGIKREREEREREEEEERKIVGEEEGKRKGGPRGERCEMEEGRGGTLHLLHFITYCYFTDF